MTTPTVSSSPFPDPPASLAQIEAWFVKHYDTLRAAAGGMRRRNDTLAPTDVANAAYVRVRQHMPTVRTEAEFLDALRKIETHILLNAVRSRNAQKRGSGNRGVELTEDVAVPGQDVVVASAEWDELLADLEQRLPDAYVVVVCRVDLGLSQAEIAALLGISERTVRNRLQQVRGWIEQRRKGHT